MVSGEWEDGGRRTEIRGTGVQENGGRRLKTLTSDTDARLDAKDTDVYFARGYAYNVL